MKIFTIGFTKKSAETFFTKLKKAGVKKILDVRLNNVSQLAGFSKRDDLKYFAQELCNIEYQYMPQLAPTKDALDEYKKNNGKWEDYEQKFMKLMVDRKIEGIDQHTFNFGCLLCSEDKPHFCHRRLVAEYLQKKWSDLKIEHL